MRKVEKGVGGREQNASKSAATLTEQTTGGDSMNKSPNNDLNVVVRPTSLHLERGKTQGTAYGAQASSGPPRTEASPRSRQESVPRPLRENHTGSASLGSGHNKDRLRYRPTERHPINSTDPRNRQPSTTLREFPGTGQGKRGVTAGITEEEDRTTKRAGKQGKERFKRG